MSQKTPSLLVSDPRLDQLYHWLAGFFKTGFALVPITGDASFRRYFRLKLPSGTCYIVSDAPPTTEKNHAFLVTRALFEQLGVHVPALIHADVDLGFFVQEDLGPDLFLNRLQAEDADNPAVLYEGALQSLLKIQRLKPTAEYDLPVFDHTLLMFEMALFRDWFLTQYLKIELTATQHDQLTLVFTYLSQLALEQPQVLVHRDYHSRNLVWRGDPHDVGVIDFQDAVWGPLTYDLASLFRDCYIAWPEASVQRWVHDYFRQAQHAGVVGAQVSWAQYLSWFKTMGLQRNLKTIGIFARLHLRDQKSGYLPDIPRTLNYAMALTEEARGTPIPELAWLQGFLKNVVHSALSQHARLQQEG